MRLSCLVLCVVAGAAMAAAPIQKLACPPPSVVRLDPATADFLVEHLAQRMSAGGVRVMTSKDLTALLTLERQKQLLGCGDSSECLTELGNALGVDGILRVELGQFETTLQINLKVISAVDARPLAQFSAQAAGEKAALARMDEAAQELVRQLGASPPPVRSCTLERCPGWTVEHRLPNTDINAIDGLDEDELWAAGSGGTVLRRNQGRWEQVATGKVNDLYGLSWSKKQLVVAGVGGTLLRWTGQGWTEEVAAPADLFALARSASGELWVAGENLLAPAGKAMKPRPEVGRLLGAWHDGRSVWAVSLRGDILRARGAQPIVLPRITADPLNAIWGSSPQDIWTVGSNGRAYHFDGKAWSLRNPDTRASLTGVRGNRADNVYAVSKAGELWRWDGAAWTSIPSPFESALYEVWVSPQGTVFVTGAEGVIGSYRPPTKE